MGKKCYDLFKTPHCRTEKCAVGRAMVEDRIISEETIARPKEGMIMPIKYTGAPIKDAKGNIKGGLEFILDITEEAAQRQDASEKIENLNVIPNSIHAVDLKYNITYINPAGAEMLGLSVTRQSAASATTFLHRTLQLRPVRGHKGHAQRNGDQ